MIGPPQAAPPAIPIGEPIICLRFFCPIAGSRRPDSERRAAAPKTCAKDGSRMAETGNPACGIQGARCATDRTGGAGRARNLLR
jgi:hypothetical protein